MATSHGQRPDRGICVPDQQHGLTTPHGTQYIVTIGINEYRSARWPRLSNAVQDAAGTLAAFARLGFKEVRSKLTDREATRDALLQLVTDDLSRLRKEDSLVLFFAGHGHCLTTEYSDGTSDANGYLIPHDADDERASTWIPIDDWLRTVGKLPPRHILVILDACHSGLALSPQARWRGELHYPDPIEELRKRMSRRVITSALDTQLAADSGPSPGHSLFTGCLLEVLSGALPWLRGLATGSQIALAVQDRVTKYPGSRQTPDLGALHLHKGGELVVCLPDRASHPAPEPADRAPAPTELSSQQVVVDRHDREHQSEPAPPRPATALDRALDRHHDERALGGPVLTMLCGELPDAAAAWGGWAGARGWLTLTSSATTLDSAVHELLAQMPWLRCVPAARKHLARAAHLQVEAIDATLDAKSPRERRIWLASIARGDDRVIAAGWLLALLRSPTMQVPDPERAPLPPRRLLAALGALTPFAVLLSMETATRSWLAHALDTAAELTTLLPRLALALTAPRSLAAGELAHGTADAHSLARQGALVVAPAPAAPVDAAAAAARYERLLHALSRDDRTKGHFERDVAMPIHERQRVTRVGLVARAERLVVQCDAWYREGGPTALADDRLQDRWLQRAGFFVQRFAAEELEQHLDGVVEEIAAGLSGRSELDTFSSGDTQ